jgi:thioredoxin reductase (NADPH)
MHVEGAFTTRGDIVHSHLAETAGAKLDEEGEIIVDHCQKTTVPGLYAAGCVTPANCQMIIAAGQGAIAGQAINRDLFEDSLQRHALPRVR